MFGLRNILQSTRAYGVLLRCSYNWHAHPPHTHTHLHRYEGYGQYGVKAVWMDEAEPDHAKYISGGQWKLHAGDDTEVLPAWVKCVRELAFAQIGQGVFVCGGVCVCGGEGGVSSRFPPARTLKRTFAL
jgi:hypothetical protein